MSCCRFRGQQVKLVRPEQSFQGELINRIRALANPCTPVQVRYSPPIIFNGLAGFLGVATVFGLDVMLAEMKEGDASWNAEVMRLRAGGRAKDSMGYRYSFSSLPRLHCLREFPT